jgi:hypothetical protein
LDAGNGGVGDGTSGQRANQFALSGARGVHVALSGVLGRLYLLFRQTQEASLHEESFQRPLLADTAQTSKALQDNIRSH